jgi:hypothetical protein
LVRGIHATRSRSSGTKAGPGSRASTTGISMTPAGTCLRRTPVVRQGRRELNRLGFALTQVHHGWIRRGAVRPSDAKACRADAAPDPQPRQARRTGVRAVPGQRHDPRRGGAHRARLLRHGTGSEVRGRGRSALGASWPAGRPNSMVTGERSMRSPRNAGAMLRESHAATGRSRTSKLRSETGNPDLQGLCLALADWSVELGILTEREKPPGLKPAAGLCERSGTQALSE